MKFRRLKQRVHDFYISALALRILGLIFLTVGLAGNVIQRTLGVGVVSNSQLWQIMQESDTAMRLAATALVFQALEALAVPIFVFLLIEGALGTSSYRNYLLRVLLLAVVCEVPYNLATSGEVLSFGSLNPVFAMASCLVMLFFFKRFPGKKASYVVIKIIAVIGAFLWSNILGISNGVCCVLLAAALWVFHNRLNLRNIAGVLTMVLCGIFSPFYIVGALAFLPIYFYLDELTPKTNRLANYLPYPIILLITWLVSSFI